MYKTALASLTGYASDAAVLETAAQFADVFGAHVDCLHVSIDIGDPAQLAAWEINAFNARIIEQMRAMERNIVERASNAKRDFEEICKRRNLAVVKEAKPAAGQVTFAYRELKGVDLEETVRAALVHDIVVAARDSRHVIFEPDRAGTIMLSCGQPVLVPPHKTAKTFGTHVVVAWKETAQSAHAVKAALPFLKKAQKVHILTVSEETSTEFAQRSGEALADQLRWHGINAEVKALKFSLKPVGESVLDEAYRLDADLIVMGGYGHSRMREVVFGGMTREVLTECEIPVLFAH